jgi:hypothetical protein
MDRESLSAFPAPIDQTPGRLPEPSTITIDTVDGNHVVLDLGGQRYAFYAHMQKNSVKVRPGDQVKKGMSWENWETRAIPPLRIFTFIS